MDNLRKLINEMNMMLDKPRMTLESFMLPENFDDEMGEYAPPVDRAPMPQQSQRPQQQGQEAPVRDQISGIEKELTQIRKIALNVITRLADNPSCEQYILMKKIWNMVDKAIETGSEKPAE